MDTILHCSAAHERTCTVCRHPETPFTFVVKFEITSYNRTSWDKINMHIQHLSQMLCHIDNDFIVLCWFHEIWHFTDEIERTLPLVSASQLCPGHFDLASWAFDRSRHQNDTPIPFCPGDLCRGFVQIFVMKTTLIHMLPSKYVIFISIITISVITNNNESVNVSKYDILTRLFPGAFYAGCLRRFYFDH